MTVPAVLAVLALAAATVVLAAGAAGACSLEPEALRFTGEAVAVDGDLVTFEVTGGDPTPGFEVEIEYVDDDSRFVDVGRQYEVTAWERAGGGLASGVHTAEDECGGGGTVHVDGSAIDTGLFTRNGFRPWVVAAPVAAVAAAVAAGWLVLRRRRSAPAPI